MTLAVLGSVGFGGVDPLAADAPEVVALGVDVVAAAVVGLG